MGRNFCSQNNGGNTGRPRCDVKMGLPYGIIAAPLNARITEQDAEDLFGFISKMARTDSVLTRWFPIMDIKNVTDSSEEATKGTLASTGFTVKLRDGAAIYQFEWISTLCSDKIINQFDGWNQGAFVVDVNRKVWGKIQANGDLMPYNVLMDVDGGGFNDGQNAKTKRLNINFGSNLIMQNVSNFWSLREDDDMANIIGLQNLDIVEVGTGAKSFQLITGCDRQPLFDQYSNILNDPQLWQIVDVTTATEIPVTAVSVNAINKSFGLTFTASGNYQVSLAPVSELEAAGVVGYESIPLLVKV